MRLFIQLALLGSLLTATTLPAQQSASAPRAIPLPDTLGANFPVTDTLTGRSGPGDYDFLVGTWSFTFQSRRENGTFDAPFTGHWVFTKKATGGQG